MAINLPTDGMDSLGALIQLQMLEQMRPSVPQQPINTPMSLPDLPMDTGMTDATPQGIAGVLSRYAENRLEEKQQPIRMETGGSVMDQLYGQLMGQIPMGQNSASYNNDYEYTPYVAGAAPQSAVAVVPDAPLAYGPEDIVIRESGFDFNDGGISDSAATGTSGVGAPSAAQAAANQSFAQAISSPVAESVFGSDVSTGLGVVSGLSGLAGVPGIGQVESVVNASPIGMLGMALGLMGLGPLGMAVGAFGKAVDVMSSPSFGDSMVGMGVMGSSYGVGENVAGSGISGGQTSGFGTTQAGPTGLGFTGYDDVYGSPMAVDPDAEAVAGLAEFTAEVEARGMDPMGVVGDTTAASVADQGVTAGPDYGETSPEEGVQGSGTPSAASASGGGGDGGGKVICTELHRQGRISDEVYASDHAVGLRIAVEQPDVVAGYHLWAIPLVNLMQKSKLVTKAVEPFGKAWANEMHYQETGKGKSSLLGRLIMSLGVPACGAVGKRLNRKVAHA